MGGQTAPPEDARRSLPTGTMTFLMTDVEGSTRMWEEHPDIAGKVIGRHDELISEAVVASSGVLMKSKGEGDSTLLGLR